MNTIRNISIVICLLAAILLANAVCAVEYQVIDLGTLGGTISHAREINNSGQIVGWADTDTGESHAVLWNPTVVNSDILVSPNPLDFGNVTERQLIKEDRNCYQ